MQTARGSVGGATFSANKGGQYVRRRSMPTNPNTAAQQARRSTLSLLSISWGLITEANRTSWNTYAANTPVVDSLGQTINLTGFQWYVGTNSLRALASLSFITTAPSTGGLSDLTQPTSIAISAGTQFLTATLSAGDTWATTGDGVLLIQMSRPLSPGVNSVKQALRFAGKTDGSTMTPPTATGNIPVPFTVTAGSKVAVRFTAQEGSGKRSEPITVLVTVGA